MISFDDRIRSTSSFVRFALVGLIATLVDFLLFNTMLFGRYAPSTSHLMIAATFGFATATYVGYQLNSRFTFRAVRNTEALGRYFAIAIGGVLIHNGTLLLFREALTTESFIELNTAKAGALSISMLWNYFGYRYFVFTQS